MALVSPSWSRWAGTVRVAAGGLSAQGRPRCLPPDPMALVTVSRSPPASGHSTPVGPSVSLALLWSCPRSWLPAGPGGARPAHGTGGAGRRTLGLSLKTPPGTVPRARRRSERQTSRGRLYPLLAQMRAKP